MTSKFFCHLRALGIALLGAVALIASAEPIRLQDSACRIEWNRTEAGWKISAVAARAPSGEILADSPDGEYTLLYSAEQPDRTSTPFFLPGHSEPFPEPGYVYNISKWKDATSPVALNIAGEAYSFFPASAEVVGEGELRFRQVSEVGDLEARWSLDPSFPGDVLVTLSLTAKQAGYFSIATPTLARTELANLEWATVPGYFCGDELNPAFVLSMVYGHGLPTRPVVLRERTASTLASIMTNRQGVTLAVVPAPGTAADPWPESKEARATWRLGLSHMNRRGDLAPTLYHPVLGEEGSRLAAGESRVFRFRYSLRFGDWFDALKHTVMDVYRLPDFLALKQPTRSLSDRLLSLHRYVTDDQSSLWRREKFGGREIGAQAYLGGVVGADKDAMKNSDYGAMWMLAHLTGDKRLVHDRLPFARNFKLTQQQTGPGFFHGAATGQYYLSKSRRFTEEWGDYVEPVAVTYYTLLDLGNMLLFEPADAELRERLRLGADRLLDWQHADGRWEVAYAHANCEPLFTELPDLRPTFYGLLVAYRILGDRKYLEAAQRGADWLLTEGVARGRFLGVCGDNRFAPDFATAQIAQALLDLYDITQESRYRTAAIATARFYTTAIFTHPLATNQAKKVGGVLRADWQINQSGLGFEHGGTIGSAADSGPILLASHAGLFLRVFGLTGEPLFRDLARAAVLARDAFVNPQTSVASYYWTGMERGAGPFPHHAWWQIGWIVDYLISEAEVRSSGQITFPAGFLTPKVGPHRSYGFAPGTVMGEAASLGLGRVELDRPGVDYLLAYSETHPRVFVILLNQNSAPTTVALRGDASALSRGRGSAWKSVSVTGGTGRTEKISGDEPAWSISLPANGWAVVSLDF